MGVSDPSHLTYYARTKRRITRNAVSQQDIHRHAVTKQAAGHRHRSGYRGLPGRGTGVRGPAGHDSAEGHLGREHRLEHRRVQSITREDIEDLWDWMLTSGRKRGGSRGPVS